MTEPLFIGLDAGATSTVVRAERGGQGSEWTHPPANPRVCGFDRAAEILSTAITTALATHPSAGTVYTVAGVAGATTKPYQDRLHVAILKQISDTRLKLHVVDDGSIAYAGAFGDISGLLIIAGTGSLLLARTTNGKEIRAGGWGYLLGDEGSAYALGRLALRAAARAVEDDRESCIRSSVESLLHVDKRSELIDVVYGTGLSVPSCAPLLVDCAANDDAEAARLIESEIEALARRVEVFVKRYTEVAQRIRFTGGLYSSAYYSRQVGEQLGNRLPDWKIEPAAGSPLEGALSAAKKLKSP